MKFQAILFLLALVIGETQGEDAIPTGPNGGGEGGGAEVVLRLGPSSSFKGRTFQGNKGGSGRARGVQENPDDPCIICPNGATAGDDYVPPYVGNTLTCAELIDYAALFETGSQDCALAEQYELTCCFTEPENPCIICPNGATEGREDNVPTHEGSSDLTCAEVINFAPQFETESDYCGVIGELDASYCCPVNDDDWSPTPPIIQPTSPPIPSAWDPCIICPNGATAGDEYAPFASSGNPTTCAEFIDAAKLYETGSQDCAFAESVELGCCLTAPQNPCIICPNGATAGDDYVPPYEGNTFTCAENIDFATLFETESDYCGLLGEVDASYCCPVNDDDWTPTPPIIQPTSPPILVLTTREPTSLPPPTPPPTTVSDSPIWGVVVSDGPTMNPTMASLPPSTPPSSMAEPGSGGTTVGEVIGEGVDILLDVLNNTVTSPTASPPLSNATQSPTLASLAEPVSGGASVFTFTVVIISSLCVIAFV